MRRRSRFCKHLNRSICHINAAIRHLKRARCETCSAPARALITANIQVLKAIRAEKRRLRSRRCSTCLCE